MVVLKLYNSLSRKKEIFKPIEGKGVGLYTCGPTVYLYAHIGNLRTYLFEDILKRILLYNGYKVRHIMNITDVGHLTSQADTGEDKVELAAKKERKTAWQIAAFYTRAFKNDLVRLNIVPPDVWIKATDTIKEQINLIKILERKGFTYKLADGIYFDTGKLKTYGRLWPKKMKLKAGARVEMVPGKKKPTDFALWKFTPKGIKRQMEWESPWGKGFPGWHTECVVMSIKELGIPFDIHCGGIDHIPIHHTNEIAQAEAAYEKLMANFWLHCEFLNVEGKKMSKSDGNVFRLEDIIQRGFSPLAFRYLCLTCHYRSKLNFTWRSLKASQNALENLYQITREAITGKTISSSKSRFKEYKKRFLGFINNDLDTPKALALLWKLTEDKKISPAEKYRLLLDFDRVFGLGLEKIKRLRISKKVKDLIKLREECRKKKDFKKSDELRKKIESLGYLIEDTPAGPKIRKINQKNVQV